MADGNNDFIESLTEALMQAVEIPGEPCATESFTISKPADMSDEDWTAWCDKICFEWNSPEKRVAAQLYTELP